MDQSHVDIGVDCSPVCVPATYGWMYAYEIYWKVVDSDCDARKKRKTGFGCASALCVGLRKIFFSFLSDRIYAYIGVRECNLKVCFPNSSFHCGRLTSRTDVASFVERRSLYGNIFFVKEATRVKNNRKLIFHNGEVAWSMVIGKVRPVFWKFSLLKMMARSSQFDYCSAK